MLNAIKAVLRCTVANGPVPILSHVAIADGHMHAFNGRMYASIKIESNPFELDGICIRADMLHAALSALGETKATAELDTEQGVLKFNSKRYRARIPVLPIDDFYMKAIPKKTKAVKIDFDLPASLAAIRGIVSDNPMLLWANGLLLDNEHIAATNTSIMANISAPCHIAPTVITNEFAGEVIAQGVGVGLLLVDDKQVIAWFDNGLVLSSVVIDGGWPKAFDVIVGPLHKGAKFVPVPEGINDALQLLVPFSADSANANVTITGNKLELISSETASASVNVDGLNASGPCAFNANQLRSVLVMATEWDLSKFPMVPFRNKELGIVGGFAGVRA